MAYKVTIDQSSVNLSCKLGSFSFMKDQVLYDDKLGAELAIIFPKLFAKDGEPTPVEAPAVVEAPVEVKEEVVVETVVEPEPEVVTVEEVVEPAPVEEAPVEEVVVEAPATVVEEVKTYNKRGPKPKGY